MGLPVLVTSARPLRRIVEAEQCGWAVLDTASDMARGLRVILETPLEQLRAMGRRGLKAVTDRYSWASYEKLMCLDVHSSGPKSAKHRSRGVRRRRSARHRDTAANAPPPRRSSEEGAHRFPPGHGGLGESPRVTALSIAAASAVRIRSHQPSAVTWPTTSGIARRTSPRRGRSARIASSSVFGNPLTARGQNPAGRGGHRRRPRCARVQEPDRRGQARRRHRASRFAPLRPSPCDDRGERDALLGQDGQASRNRSTPFSGLRRRDDADDGAWEDRRRARKTVAPPRLALDVGPEPHCG